MPIRILCLYLFAASLALAQHVVVIVWSASPVDPTHDAPTNYNIKRATSAGVCAAKQPACVQVGTVPAPTLTFTDTASATNTMTAGQTFFYVITAQNNAGETEPTAEVSATIPGFLPNKPLTVSATAH